MDVSEFRMRLLKWYDREHRSLPWRKTRSPYRIWVSEIMLQQTRVAVVVQRYREFLKRFPSLRSLACSRESEVLAAWSGLGYYRRARSLGEAARVVVKKHSGRVPRELETLKTLPGVGEYTAAAIASIAFAKPHAVVDGNVKRVLTRISGRAMTGGTHWKSAQQLLAPDRPGDFNQAMMELGATVCTPTPNCKGCPVSDLCASRERTAKLTGKPRARRVRQELALAVRSRAVYLLRRPKSAGIMPLMWELPPAHDRSAEKIFALKHSITNTLYSVEVYRAESLPGLTRGRWVNYKRLKTIPLTGLTRKILQRIAII